MKRIYIITGAKGHLASTIIRYLRKENCHIRGLILPSENGEADHFSKDMVTGAYAATKAEATQAVLDACSS